MDDKLILPVSPAVTEREVNALLACNEFSVRFGLTLTHEQVLSLERGRQHALASTSRVEFGEGILKKLVYVFCSSPYISQAGYESTLLELQDAFYYLKNACGDRLSDDELLERMEKTFNGKAGGSVDYTVQLVEGRM